MRWAFSGSAALFVVLGVGACQSGEPGGPAFAPDEQTTPLCGEGTTYENFAGPFFLSWCTGCHSSELGPTERQGAPVGVDFDTRAGVEGRTADIVRRVLDDRTMPPAGGPSDDERALLKDWIACGAPAEDPYFDPPPPKYTEPEPMTDTRTCAAAREALPASILPRCSAATRSCRDACASAPGDADACREACVKLDLTPPATTAGGPVDCGACILYQLLACGDEVGCHDQVATLMCCIEDCAKSGDPACGDTKCRGPIDSFGQCVYYRGEKCLKEDGPYVGACFAPF